MIRATGGVWAVRTIGFGGETDGGGVRVEEGTGDEGGPVRARIDSPADFHRASHRLSSWRSFSIRSRCSSRACQRRSLSSSSMGAELDWAR
jgi:hypothetical protein